MNLVLGWIELWRLPLLQEGVMKNLKKRNPKHIVQEPQALGGIASLEHLLIVMQLFVEA